MSTCLGKLDCLCPKEKSFWLTKGRILTSFRGGPIQIFSLLLNKFIAYVQRELQEVCREVQILT